MKKILSILALTGMLMANMSVLMGNYSEEEFTLLTNSFKEFDIPLNSLAPENYDYINNFFNDAVKDDAHKIMKYRNNLIQENLKKMQDLKAFKKGNAQIVGILSMLSAACMFSVKQDYEENNGPTTLQSVRNLILGTAVSLASTYLSYRLTVGGPADYTAVGFGWIGMLSGGCAGLSLRDLVGRTARPTQVETTPEVKKEEVKEEELILEVQLNHKTVQDQ